MYTWKETKVNKVPVILYLRNKLAFLSNVKCLSKYLMSWLEKNDCFPQSWSIFQQFVMWFYVQKDKLFNYLYWKQKLSKLYLRNKVASLTQLLETSFPRLYLFLHVLCHTLCTTRTNPSQVKWTFKKHELISFPLTFLTIGVKTLYSK